MNNKNFQRGLAAVMLFMMVVPLIVSTQVSVKNYKNSQEEDVKQEVVMTNTEENAEQTKE